VYVCMYVCMYLCMYLCMYICMYICMYVRMYACMYVCMSLCMCVCMYVCMYVYVCIYVHRLCGRFKVEGIDKLPLKAIWSWQIVDNVAIRLQAGQRTSRVSITGRNKKLLSFPKHPETL
jgi:hypothetical protein